MPTLDFEGKAFVYSHHLSVPYRELVPVPDKGVGEPSLDSNLIIHGDNLEALKALLPRYAGKVDVIYIDPPYNTGNEGWAYNDNVNSPLMKDWLGKVVDREDLQRHDKWLCMMWPRLQLLWELLSESGSIWISCDDNAANILRSTCDEIFGEKSFVDTVIWQKNYSPKPTANQFSADHDYIYVYAKGGDKWKPGLLKRTEKQLKAYTNIDNDPRGAWKTGDFSLRNYYSEGQYPITTPSGRVIKGPPAGRYWASSESKLKELDADGRIWWGEKGNNLPAVKQFLSEVRDGRVPQTLWFYTDVGHTQEAKQELFGVMEWGTGEDGFITPKPSRLVERIMDIGGEPDALVLDSFAGSGTTGHAVLAANAKDGGSRKFILIETEDYADTLTAERVRRVIKGVPAAKDEALKAGLGGTFTYCELGEAMDTERFFAAGDAPAWGQVARYVVFTATGESVAAPEAPGENGFVAVAGGRRVHLLYRPDLGWLRSSEAALTLDRARALRAAGGDTPILVFSSAQYVSSRTLRELDITFAQLPWPVHQRLAPVLAPAEPADAPDVQP